VRVEGAPKGVGSKNSSSFAFFPLPPPGGYIKITIQMIPRRFNLLFTAFMYHLISAVEQEKAKKIRAGRKKIAE
jgi:hypothetical protein